DPSPSSCVSREAKHSSPVVKAMARTHKSVRTGGGTVVPEAKSRMRVAMVANYRRAPTAAAVRGAEAQRAVPPGEAKKPGVYLPSGDCSNGRSLRPSPFTDHLVRSFLCVNQNLLKLWLIL